MSEPQTSVTIAFTIILVMIAARRNWAQQLMTWLKKPAMPATNGGTPSG